MDSVIALILYLSFMIFVKLSVLSFHAKSIIFACCFFSVYVTVCVCVCVCVCVFLVSVFFCCLF